jgi:hypothetical protein
MTTGKSQFILSFDCEGKWGMASDPSMVNSHAISDSSLHWAYQQIFESLKNFNISASFGVVGLFAQDLSAFETFDAAHRAEPAYASWFHNPKAAFRARNTDGWFYPTLIEDIQGFKIHEVSSHSYTHLPFHNEFVTREIVENELRVMNQFLLAKGVSLQTMIYPQNQVVHTDLLPEFRISGYRDSNDKRSAYGSKIGTLVDEFNVFSKSSAHSRQEVPIKIPAGYFLNWQNGPRLIIPPTITVRRFNHLLDHAERTGGVVHMWLHPHNLITGKNQVQLFNRVLQTVAQRQSQGSLSVLTMGDYCKQISTPPTSPN